MFIHSDRFSISSVYYKNLVGSVTHPVKAGAAAVSGEARYFWHSIYRGYTDHARINSLERVSKRL